ncbi:Gp5.5-like host HNS inhibition [Escherichia phage LM33_P1]|uniref:Phage HNS binding protein n=1 Tax=Escherichia phage LM33_P1 TaxID=1788294 RepID=A0A1A8YFJ4_9CAUD|nr:Gp5.5-like host HNS inhibition [Escherichia phage LM33_P1]SBT28114.1 Phage HNS binding protein [Escherichia phage LM33_P1]
MAMTKRAIVSFNLKAVLPTDQEEIIIGGLRELAKSVNSGEIEPDGKQRHMLTLWLTEGMDSVIEFVLRASLRSMVKDAVQEYSDSEFFSVSPATVRFKQ